MTNARQLDEMSSAERLAMDEQMSAAKTREYVDAVLDFADKIMAAPKVEFSFADDAACCAAGCSLCEDNAFKPDLLRDDFRAFATANANSRVPYPDANPKAAIGALKVPLHLVPPSTRHFLALALEDGAKKYGPYNWRESGISISTYIGAAARHLDAFWDGEDNATDSGVHHVAHALACCAILLDAMTVGKLVDDRPPAGAASQLQTAYVASRKSGASK